MRANLFTNHPLELFKFRLVRRDGGWYMRLVEAPPGQGFHLLHVDLHAVAPPSKDSLNRKQAEKRALAYGFRPAKPDTKEIL